LQASDVTLVNQQLRVTHDVDEQHMADLEFYLRETVGRHLTRAHFYARQ
jgi:hypothetical protein